MDSINRFSAKSEIFIEEGCYITELRNVGNDPDCSVARARVEPGAKTKLHRLQGTVERYVILEGVGEVEVGGARAVSVGPLDVVHIPKGVPQRIRNIGSKDLIFLCICTPRFKPEAYEKLDG